jgi:tetratricopeptide (TPR) repeat protein
MLPFRSSSGYFLLLCVILPNSGAFGSDPSAAIPLGSPVLAKRPGVNFRIKNEDVGPMRAGVIERVQKVQGEWLWIGRGWVQRTDIVPLWEAVEYFDAEIGRKPTAFAYVGRASAAGKRGAFPGEVHAHLDKALALDEDFAPAHRLRGVQLRAQNDLDGAIDALDDAIRADPRFAEAYAERGTAFLERFGRSKDVAADERSKDTKRATRVCPRLASPYTLRASLFTLAGDHEKAFAQAQEALKHDPADARAYLSVGQYWLAKGDESRAIAAYAEAIRVDRRCGPARLERGKIYLRMGDDQKAVLDLNQAVQLMPASVEALEAREFVFYRLGAVEKSRADRLAVSRLRGMHSETTTKTGGSAIETPAALAPIAKEFLRDGQPPSQPADTPDGSKSTQATSSAAPPVSEATPQDQKRTAVDQLNLSARRAATSMDERYLNGPRAVELATEACEKTDWKRADLLDTLAAAYAETGDFEAAIKWQIKAIELGVNARFKADAEARLSLYRDHQPCREEVPGRLARGKQAEHEAR